ncbi:MAG: lytic transglycosylase domain-containing protein [Microbacteriaceae bacterium]
MTRYRRGLGSLNARRSVMAGIDGRHTRASWSLPVFAFVTSCAFVLASVIDPTAAHAMRAEDPETVVAPIGVPQSITVAEGESQVVSRDAFGVSKIITYGKAPTAGTPDPGSAQAIAYGIVQERGWGDDEYSCLVSLWSKESGWNVYAHNKRSGAYGIPQALPGAKMASAGADWETSAYTQIIWGLGYIEGRYERPCGAWASSQQRGWY